MVLSRNDDEVIEWLLKDYPSGEVLAQSAGKLIQKFSWSHCARRFVELADLYKDGSSSRDGSRTGKKG